MPTRIQPLTNGEYYHIYNRGVDRMDIFKNSYYLQRFIKTMLYYKVSGPKPRFSLFSPTNRQLDKNKQIVEIISYCLMPNHFHLLLKQLVNGGITEFISKLSNSYTKYYNTKNKRVGPILQGEFKSVLVENNEQLLHVSRYIHLNPLVSGLVDDLSNYIWSSYPEYIGSRHANFCAKEIILDQFKSTENYNRFVLDQKDYGKELEIIKHQLLENFE